jgi:sodium transport system permease protein
VLDQGTVAEVCARAGARTLTDAFLARVGDEVAAMRLAIVLHIFRKDLVETLRDRRTVGDGLPGAGAGLSAALHLLGSVATDKRGELERTRARVAAWGAVPPSSLSAVEQHARADIVDRRDQLPADPEAEARKLVTSRKVHVVLLTPPGASGASIPVRVLADSTNVDSDAMERRVSRALTDQACRAPPPADDGARAGRLGGPAARRQGGGPRRRRAPWASFAAALLPYLLLVLVATSGFYAALDLTAGEKERGTLQTLLTAPVRSVEIVAGKYLAVLALTLAATVCNLGSIALTLSRATAAMETGARFSLGLSSAGSHLPHRSPGGVADRRAPDGHRRARAELSRGAELPDAHPAPGDARRLRELSPRCAALRRDRAGAAPQRHSPGARHPRRQGGRDAGDGGLGGEPRLGRAGILLAARVFQTEQVLLSGEKPWRDVFAPGVRSARGLTPGNALAFAAVLLVLTFYGSALVERRGGWQRSSSSRSSASSWSPRCSGAGCSGRRWSTPCSCAGRPRAGGRRRCCSRPAAGASGRWSGNSSFGFPERVPTPTGWASSSASRGGSGWARPCSWWRSCRRSPRR